VRREDDTGRTVRPAASGTQPPALRLRRSRRWGHAVRRARPRAVVRQGGGAPDIDGFAWGRFRSARIPVCRGARPRPEVPAGHRCGAGRRTGGAVRASAPPRDRTAAAGPASGRVPRGRDGGVEQSRPGSPGRTPSMPPHRVAPQGSSAGPRGGDRQSTGHSWLMSGQCVEAVGSRRRGTVTSRTAAGVNVTVPTRRLRHRFRRRPPSGRGRPGPAVSARRDTRTAAGRRPWPS
jgi:hypothetical protein